MPLHPLHLCSLPHVRVVGDVTIHPSAAIAPGAILLATPQGRIEIAAGVCIGMGVILNAGDGAITIAEGASLGPGVLIIGPCHIGTNSCIGGLSTLYAASVPDMAVILAGSLLGAPSDHDRPSHSVASSASSPERQTSDLESDPWSSETAAPIPDPPSQPTPSPDPPTHFPESSPPVEPSAVTSKPDESDPQQSDRLKKSKVMINQLLITLFPHDEQIQSRQQDQS
jgi:carbon dioxide concentrating mechanism protein CcmN